MEWSLWAYFIQIASFQGIHGLGKNHHTGWTTLGDAPLCELFNLLKIFIYLSLFVYLFIIIIIIIIGEWNDNPLQYSCLENPKEEGAS